MHASAYQLTAHCAPLSSPPRLRHLQLMCIILPMLLMVWFLEHLLGASQAEHRQRKAIHEAEKAAAGEPNVAVAAILAESQSVRLADTLSKGPSLMTTTPLSRKHASVASRISIKRRRSSQPSAVFTPGDDSQSRARSTPSAMSQRGTLVDGPARVSDVVMSSQL